MKRRFSHLVASIRRVLFRRRTLYVLGVLCGLFVVANLVTYGVYRNRTYPNTEVAGQKYGSVPLSQAEDKLSNMPLLPQDVDLKYENNSESLSPQDLGISLDTQKLAASLSHRSWLPIANFFTDNNHPLAITVNNQVLTEQLEAFASKYAKPATNAQVTVKDGAFSVTPSAPGVAADMQVAQALLVDQVVRGADSVQLPVAAVKPAVVESNLQADVAKFQTQQKTALTYVYGANRVQPSTAEVANWYAASGSTMALSDPKIQAYINSVGAKYGIGVDNLAQLTAATKSALESNKATTMTLIAKPKASKTYTYCTAVRGVDPSYLGGLQSKLQAVFADGRGWSLGGLVDYKYATGGCNFTVWLAAANQMLSFGAICDSMWSCAVSPNVVINFDRWQGASPAWNASGGSLDDYRSMVINHETGHWLGFGHANCGGAGLPAPVMQQQSISLQGCAFNPWPLPSEQAALKRTLGL